MPTLHLLGTGAALSDAERTTTMLALERPSSVLVVDCGGDVVQRLLAAGIELDRIEGMILTHEHPDHVSGFPLFMEKIWLAQRRRPVRVFGPETAIAQARRIFEAFDTSGWEEMPRIEWRSVPLEEHTLVLEESGWKVTASPGNHSVPVIGLRFEDLESDGVVAYSADTAPSEAIARLAAGADILVHEATGDFSGHTSAQGAAELAREAGVGRLVLVHLPPEIGDGKLGEARDLFAATELGTDGAGYSF